MSNVLEASKASYKERLATGVHETQKDRILDYIQKVRRCTAKMIARDLNLESATVSGLVRPLVKDEKSGVWREEERNECPVTGNKVHWLYWVEHQTDLFN